MRVVFGPWIGELGWELTSWQGWVRRVCQEEYKDYEKVIVSFPGREVLYGGIDNVIFDSHPWWFQEINYSPRAYATDFWTKYGPVIKRAVYRGPIMEQHCTKLLKEYKLRYEDAQFIVPWERFKYKGFDIGGITQVNKRLAPLWVPKLIPKKLQRIIQIRPSAEHVSLLHNEMSLQGFSPESKLILIFPRSRIKNSDKNWSKKYCEQLINKLQETYSDYVVGIVGSPDGAYFADGVPSGCLDMISIKDPFNRLNIHVAAMSQSVVGLGPASGIIHVAMWAGLPCVCNIEKRTHKKYPTRFTKDENPFNVKVKMVCGNVSVDKITNFVGKMI